jgi:hypothetical protein
MGFFIGMKTYWIFLSGLLTVNTILTAQTKPEWTNTQKNTISNSFYYGIGTSQTSSEEADTRAFIEFSRNVELKVKSIFQNEIREQGKDFSERTNISTELISDVSLKGIAITERYADTTSKIFFSLIQYRKTEYDSLVQFQIEREVVLMKVRNKMLEEKRQEELRFQKIKNQQEEEAKKEEIRAKQEEMTIEQKRLQQREQEEDLYRKIYGEFLKIAPPEKVVSLRNGEISNGDNSLMLKTGLAPLRFNGGYYAHRFWLFELSGNAIVRNGKLNQQEAYFKIQVLPRVGEFTKTTLAIGAVQAVALISDSGYNFKRSKYSLFISGNISIPEYSYSTFSFYGDKRKISIGATTFPFYSQFKHHLGFVLEGTAIFDKDFRNAKGNTFVVNGGVRLQASELFTTQLVYEDYEQLNLTFEFQF